MTGLKKTIILLAALFVFLCIAAFVVGSIANLIIPPSEAFYSDEVVEDIGGDNALVATLKSCLKVSEKNIPDGSFKTALGQNLMWRNAKNISYVDTNGKHGNMIVWKASPEGYNAISDTNSISFISDYLDSNDGNCFLVHFPEKNAVYGIILTSDEIKYSEYDLVSNILGLNISQFPLTYEINQPSYSSNGGGSSHYHTVVPDRYTLSRTDPGAYYDHYEYGDNYDIDNYLESEGFD